MIDQQFQRGRSLWVEVAEVDMELDPMQCVDEENQVNCDLGQGFWGFIDATNVVVDLLEYFNGKINQLHDRCDSAYHGQGFRHLDGAYRIKTIL